MYCSKCGKEIPDGGVFCSYCGQSMSATPAKPKTSPLRILLGVAVGVVLLLLTGFLLMRESPTVDCPPGQLPDASGRCTPVYVSEPARQAVDPVAQLQQQVQRQKEEQLQARYKETMANLYNEMARLAATTAQPRHSASRIQTCSESDHQITRQDGRGNSEFLVSFECRMVGTVFGIDRFVVGVKVRAQTVRTGDDITAGVMGSWVDSDRRD